MAFKVLTDPYVMINLVDLSDCVSEVRLSYSAEEKPIRPGGKTSQTRLAGIKDWKADLIFYQDFAATKVDATLFGIVGTQVACIFRADSDTVGETNPEFTGNGTIFEYSPIDGAVGDEMTAPVSIMGSDGVLLDRAITA